jgi:hypothetical protein
MALFTDAVIDRILALVLQQHNALGGALGAAPALAEPQEARGPLRAQLQLLVRVANGELAHSSVSRETEREVESALTAVLEALLGNALHVRIALPDAFWRTEIGTLASRVRWWLSADDLITISNAAALAFGSNSQATRMRIVRAIDSGLLDWIPDPSVANPQHNRRVLRSQVERLRDQRQLPI